MDYAPPIRRTGNVPATPRTQERPRTTTDRPVQLVSRFKLDGSSAWFDATTHFDPRNKDAFQQRVQAAMDGGHGAGVREMYRRLNANATDHHDAWAASHLRTVLNDDAGTRARAAADEPQIEHLPKSQWWKMYIDRERHDPNASNTINALRFDNEQSPGFHNMMMNAMETVTATPHGQAPAQHTFAGYDALHRAVTTGAFRATRDGSFEPVGHKLASDNIMYGMSGETPPSAQALRELIAEGTAGLAEDDTHDLVQQAHAEVEHYVTRPHASAADANVTPDTFALLRQHAQAGTFHQLIPTLPRDQQMAVARKGFTAMREPALATAHAHLTTLQNAALPPPERVATYKNLLRHQFNLHEQVAAEATHAKKLTVEAGGGTYAPGSRFYRQVKVGGQSVDRSHLRDEGAISVMNVATTRNEPTTRAIVGRTLERHDAAMADAANAPDVRRAKIEGIAKTVRSLHVTHAYSDANGRLNTVLLLNKLLREQGLSPSVVAHTSDFGGAKTAAELADAIQEGQAHFRGLLPPVQQPQPQPVQLRRRSPQPIDFVAVPR